MDGFSGGSSGGLSPGNIGDDSPGALVNANRDHILRDWKLSSEESLPRNRDSWDEVNEIAIALPLNMGEKAIDMLPTWLSKASEDGGSRLVAEKFRLLEKLQEQRLNGTYNTVLGEILGPSGEDPTRYRFAGDGANAKNRYRDIYPYEHSRVKLLNLKDDYINASHLSVQSSPKKYILSQAPMPAAFNASHFQFHFCGTSLANTITGFLGNGLGTRSPINYRVDRNGGGLPHRSPQVLGTWKLRSS